MKRLNSRGGGKMSFTFLFYKHIMFRKSCSKCHFTNLKRPSDITLADFWGWEKTDPTINADDKGYSLVLLNTEKGKRLFEAVKNRMNTVPVDVESCIQPNMVHPTIMDERRDKFQRDYERWGFRYVYFMYGEDGFPYKFGRKKQKMKQKIKQTIKRLLNL